MRVIRAKNSDIIGMIQDHLIEDKDYTKEAMSKHMTAFMDDSPESFLAAVLIEEPLDIKGFLLAYIPPERKHLFVLQTWCDPELATTEWPKKLFDEVVSFAKENKLNEIRGETLRSPEAILRKWGFKTYSTVITYELED